MSIRQTLAAALFAGAGLFSAQAIATNDSEDGRNHRHPHRKAPFSVKIIGFNDYHGSLQSPGTFGVNTSIPLAQRPAVGGADYLAGYVARLKARDHLNVVVGAGDFIGAALLISVLFFDEPAVETLNRIGLEFNSVGDHEFDKGSAELKRLQHGGCKFTNGVPDPNSCKGLGSHRPGRFDGAKFKWRTAARARSSGPARRSCAAAAEPGRGPVRTRSLTGHAAARGSASFRRLAFMFRARPVLTSIPRGFAIVTWAGDGLSYAVASDLDATELQRFAGLVQATAR